MFAEGFKIEYLIGPPAFIVLIFLALLLHEMGHYVAARFFRIPIESVVIGRGKTLKHWNDKRSVRWSVRRWPMGAHVHLADFNASPYWQRAITILAGPFTNFAVLPFLFFAFYMAVGQPSTPAVLVGIEQGLVAEKAGLQPGDQFLAVNDQRLLNFQDVWRIAYAKGPVANTYTIQRGEEIFDQSLTPDWTEYDEDGIKRENARFGVTWQHAPFKLSAVMSVNGQETGTDETTRQALLKNLGKETLVGLKGPDGQARLFTVRLSKTLNANLKNSDHEDFGRVYLGSGPGNIYLQQDFSAQAKDALRYSSDLIIKLAGVPFQLFPIDDRAIRDSHAVTNPDTKIINILYVYLHLFAVASVIVGLVNLLPLPGLDGGQLLTQTIEKIHKRALTRKTKAKIFALAFLLFYLSALFTNLDNVPGYIDSRLKKVHEFIDNTTSLEKDEASNG